MAKNDFMTGFLQGLYNAGVGNPAVSQEKDRQIQEQQAKMDTSMSKQGQMPSALPDDHPVRSKIQSFISSLMGGPSQSLNRAYQPDPNAPPTLDIDPETGQMSIQGKRLPGQSGGGQPTPNASPLASSQSPGSSEQPGLSSVFSPPSDSKIGPMTVPASSSTPVPPTPGGTPQMVGTPATPLSQWGSPSPTPSKSIKIPLSKGQGARLLTQKTTDKNLVSVWQNAEGDVVSVAPKDLTGWTELKVNPNTALQAGMSKSRNASMMARADAMNRGIDVKQIDTLVKTVGLTPKMVSSIQNTAVRAQRGIDILNTENVTWQQLNAAGIDFAGIMQGGAPHVGEVVNSQFPNWHQNVAKWETYLHGNNPANVPEGIRKQMMGMLQGVAGIDYQFVRSNNKFNKTMIGPTIRGGLNPTQNQAMTEMEGQMTGQNSPGGGGQVTQFKNLLEAQAANLPKGTRISIDGRMATVQ